MEDKYAVLSYSKEKKTCKKAGIFSFFKKTELEYELESNNLLGVEGFNVTMPITSDENDKELVDNVYTSILNRLSEMGVKSIVAPKGSVYTYDDIIPALSGFYILPYILPLITKKCASHLNNDNFELLIIDGLADLTIDILCIASNHINRISVLTDKTETFEETAEKFYNDSGLNIYVTEKETDADGADVIINASFNEDKLTNKYKRGAIFFDFAGDKKRTCNMASARPDMLIADGVELKAGDKYIDNVLLEAVLYASLGSFRDYLKGRYNNEAFYEILDKVESLNLKLTTFKRLGNRI